MIERNTADTEYTTSYYQIKNNKNLLDISQRFDVMSVLKMRESLKRIMFVLCRSMELMYSRIIWRFQKR